MTQIKYTKEQLELQIKNLSNEIKGERELRKQYMKKYNECIKESDFSPIKCKLHKEDIVKIEHNIKNLYQKRNYKQHKYYELNRIERENR